MIELTTKSEAFSFVVDQKKLSEALSLISSQAGKEPDFILALHGGKLWACTVSTSFIGMTQVKVEASKGEGSFGFDIIMLQGVVKGRSTFNFNYTGSELEFEALKTKYKGKMVTLPVTKEQASTFNEVAGEKIKGVKLSEAVLEEISKAVGLVSIKQTLTPFNTLNSLIEVNKGELHVASFDDYHMILYSSKIKCADMKFSINPHTLMGISKAIGSKFELSVKAESLRFQNKSCLYIVPTVQAEDDKFGIVFDYIKHLGDAKFSTTLKSEPFLAVCENLYAIHTVNSQFDFTVKDSLKIKFKTEQGSASDQIGIEGCKGKGGCSVSPHSFVELLRLHKSFSPTVSLSGFSSVARLSCKKGHSRLRSAMVLTDTSDKGE